MRGPMVKSHPMVAAVVGAGLIALIATVGYAGVETATNSGTVRVAATDDATTTSAAPDSNDGAARELRIGQASGETTLGYLRFRVPKLPEGTVVSRAMVLVTAEATPLPGPVSLFTTKAAEWSQRSVTARSAPSLVRQLDTVNPEDQDRLLAFDVTEEVSRGGTYTFALASASREVVRLRSTEYGDSGPVLEVTRRPAGRELVRPGAPATAPPSHSPASATGPARVPPPASPTRSPAKPACTVTAKLVPTCGVWWGVAPGAFTKTPPVEALRHFESKAQRPARVFHVYHRGDELFPTAPEIAAARDPQHRRLLFINWKVAAGTTWRAVAAGREDARIDRLAAHIKRTYPERFFLAIHHEPENDVRTAPGSGMTAKDYAVMYRHTVNRLRERGVTNAVTVMAYMGYEQWGKQAWFEQLYPGDDVVDWIGFDPYVTSKPGAYHYGDFAKLVNLTTEPARWPGFYSWATRKHPHKPLMLSEWGVFEHGGDPARKAWIYSTVAWQLDDFPAIRGLVYFDSPRAPRGDTTIDSSAVALAAFRRVAALTAFNVTP